MTGALQSQSPGLDLQRQEAEQQAQPRRQQSAHDGAVEMRCPEEAGPRRPNCYKYYNKKNKIKVIRRGKKLRKTPEKTLEFEVISNK